MSVTPGQITFIRTSDFSLAAATALAMPITAYLVAVYIGSTGTTPRPAVEAVMVMAPPCFPIFGKNVLSP